MPYLTADSPARPSQQATMTVYADLLSVKIPSIVSFRSDRVGGSYPKRGSITTFSRRSRTRFFRRLATFRNLDRGLFVTLTYPGDFDHVQRQYKRDLHNFNKALHRVFPDIRAIWRMEYKVRLSGGLQGHVVPHFHLLVFGDITDKAECLEAFRAWVATVWNRIVAPDDSDHLAAGTQVDTISSRRHAMFYCGKYAAKVNETIAPEFVTGRMWGYWGKWDTAEFLKIALFLPQFQFLKLYVANYLRATNSDRRWRYGMAILRAPPNKGINVLGLGDMSNDCTDAFNSDIMRLSLKVQGG